MGSAYERAGRTPSFLLRVPQPRSWPAAIGIDGLDACRLEHAADGLIIDPGELGLALVEFGAYKI